nr:hypothetical protein [Tanacetum cinerariifolium]
SENEVTLEDKRECDVPIFENSPICNDHSEIFSDSKNDDDISVYDDFEDIEYIEASLSDPEIVNVVLREKLLSITRLISNIESLNDNPTPDHVLNSFVSDNSLSDNFSPEFETFCDHTEETRSGNTTTHAIDSLPEYDSFCFEIEPDQERLINVVKSNISNDSLNDHLLEEADLFLAFDNSIPPVSLPPPEPPDAEFDAGKEIPVAMNDKDEDDNPSVSLPPPEPPDAEFDAGKEIPVAMNDKDEDVDYSSFIFIIYPEMFPSLIFVESEDTIFDPGFFPSVIEVFLCWIFVSVSKIFISFL